MKIQNNKSSKSKQISEIFDYPIPRRHQNIQKNITSSEAPSWSRTVDSTLKKGRFEAKEVAALKAMTLKYFEDRNMSYEEGIRSLFEKDVQSRGFYKHVSRCLPERSLHSIYLYIRRHWKPDVKLGKWSVEEEAKLLELSELYNYKWSTIAHTLGRLPETVYDKWKEIEPKLEQFKKHVYNSTSIDEQGTATSGDTLHQTNSIDVHTLKVGGTSNFDSNKQRKRTRVVVHFDDNSKERLIEAVRKLSKEDAFLPGRGIQWSKLRGMFPMLASSDLRRHYANACFKNLTDKLGKTVASNIIIRHTLRFLRRRRKSISDISEIEWCEILPIIPSSIVRRLFKAIYDMVLHEVEEGCLPFRKQIKNLCIRLEVFEKEEKDCTRLFECFFPDVSDDSIRTGKQKFRELMDKLEYYKQHPLCSPKYRENRIGQYMSQVTDGSDEFVDMKRRKLINEKSVDEGVEETDVRESNASQYVDSSKRGVEIQQKIRMKNNNRCESNVICDDDALIEGLC